MINPKVVRSQVIGADAVARLAGDGLTRGIDEPS
jgi:hypothetical protein